MAEYCNCEHENCNRENCNNGDDGCGCANAVTKGTDPATPVTPTTETRKTDYTASDYANEYSSVISARKTTSESTSSIPEDVVHTALGTSTTTPWAISKTIPASFDESLSYLEMMMAILSKQNELVAKMNSVIEVLKNHEVEIGDLYDITEKLRTDLETAIADYTAKITNVKNELNNRVDQEVATLNSRIDTEVDTLNTRITKEVDDLNTRITNEVATLNARITELYNELVTTIQNNYDTLDTKIDTINTTLITKIETADNLLQTNIDSVNESLSARIDKEVADLKSEMESCCEELRNLIESRYNELLTHSDKRDDELQYNLNAVYNLLMAGALTAEEYDALEITADNYDSGKANKINGYQLTAHDYDTNGKYYLMGEEKDDSDPIVYRGTYFTTDNVSSLYGGKIPRYKYGDIFDNFDMDSSLFIKVKFLAGETYNSGESDSSVEADKEYEWDLDVNYVSEMKSNEGAEFIIRKSGLAYFSGETAGIWLHSLSSPDNDVKNERVLTLKHLQNDKAITVESVGLVGGDEFGMKPKYSTGSLDGFAYQQGEGISVMMNINSYKIVTPIRYFISQMGAPFAIDTSGIIPADNILWDFNFHSYRSEGQDYNYDSFEVAFQFPTQVFKLNYQNEKE